MSNIDIQLQAAKDIVTSGPNFIKNMSPEDIHRMIKYLVNEIDLGDFNLDCANADAKNARWLLAQAGNVKQERDRYREAGAVLLRAIYESGIAYGDAEIASALAVFADK